MTGKIALMLSELREGLIRSLLWFDFCLIFVDCTFSSPTPPAPSASSRAQEESQPGLGAELTGNKRNTENGDKAKLFQVDLTLYKVSNPYL